MYTIVYIENMTKQLLELQYKIYYDLTIIPPKVILHVPNIIYTFCKNDD